MSDPISHSGAKGAVDAVAPERWQSAVARRSAEARATVPDVDLTVTVDATNLIARQAELGCGSTSLLVRACALALREHPAANSAYRDGGFERYGRINVGVLISGPDLYTIPTVIDADRKALPELTEELTDLAARARAGTLAAPQLSGATFTLWDMGPLRVERCTPLIVPPQAASVAAGCARTVPIVSDGTIVPGSEVTVTLAADHRILYGAAAAAFLVTIKSRLEEASL